MVLQNNLGFGTGEKITSSFDFTDIANGFGYETFYGNNGDDGEYSMVASGSIAAERIHTYTEQVISTSSVKYIDIDFDINFNLPRNLKGVVIGNIPIALVNKAAGARFGLQAKMVVKHIASDATETILGTGTSDEAFSNDTLATNGSTGHYLQCAYDQTTVKHFKKGEKLRLTIEGYYRVETGTPNVLSGIGHDPQNRDDAQYRTAFTTINEAIFNTGEQTRLQFFVPFVVQI